MKPLEKDCARIQMLIATLVPLLGGLPPCSVRGSSWPLGRQSLKAMAARALGESLSSSLGKTCMGMCGGVGVMVVRRCKGVREVCGVVRASELGA